MSQLSHRQKAMVADIEIQLRGMSVGRCAIVRGSMVWRVSHKDYVFGPSICPDDKPGTLHEAIVYVMDHRPQRFVVRPTDTTGLYEVYDKAESVSVAKMAPISAAMAGCRSMNLQADQ